MIHSSSDGSLACTGRGSGEDGEQVRKNQPENWKIVLAAAARLLLLESGV